MLALLRVGGYAGVMSENMDIYKLRDELRRKLDVVNQAIQLLEGELPIKDSIRDGGWASSIPNPVVVVSANANPQYPGVTPAFREAIMSFDKSQFTLKDVYAYISRKYGVGDINRNSAHAAISNMKKSGMIGVHNKSSGRQPATYIRLKGELL